jgi:serine phosphatase RsbU (regulator of sigma subunit)
MDVLCHQTPTECVRDEKWEEDDEDGGEARELVEEEARAVERQAREVEREVAARQVALLHAVGRAAELRQRLRLAQRAVAHRDALLAAIHDHILASAAPLVPLVHPPLTFNFL